jgi:RNA polymerase sigma factor (sigma-70 family)
MPTNQESKDRQRYRQGPSVDKESLLRTLIGLQPAASESHRNQAAVQLQSIFLPLAEAVARRFPGIDAHDCAAEAVQEWWCQTASIRLTYDPAQPLFQYAAQSLRYITIDLAKRRQRWSPEVTETPDLAGLDGDPREIVERREFTIKSHMAIKNLSACVQAAITMRFEQEISYIDIAAALGVSAARVYRWIQDALPKLQNDLRDFSP